MYTENPMQFVPLVVCTVYNCVFHSMCELQLVVQRVTMRLSVCALSAQIACEVLIQRGGVGFWGHVAVGVRAFRWIRILSEHTQTPFQGAHMAWMAGGGEGAGTPTSSTGMSWASHRECMRRRLLPGPFEHVAAASFVTHVTRWAGGHIDSARVCRPRANGERKTHVAQCANVLRLPPAFLKNWIVRSKTSR